MPPHPSRGFWAQAVRVLIVATLLFQQLAFPLQAFAESPPAAQSLSRGPGEELDAYLERVALSQPELFQQAALTAVQDALNGGLPAQPGDQALEEQIALYLDRAAQGDFPGGSSSSIEGDTYRWNASQMDPNSGLGSEWALTAQPGGDPQLFAQYFEEMMATEFPTENTLAAAPQAFQPQVQPVRMGPEWAAPPAVQPQAANSAPPTGWALDALPIQPEAAPNPVEARAPPAPEEAPPATDMRTAEPAAPMEAATEPRETVAEARPALSPATRAATEMDPLVVALETRPIAALGELAPVQEPVRIQAPMPAPRPRQAPQAPQSVKADLGVHASA
ncbi:MAG: hypothetical protein D6790_19735, partial [Caldilineae bacterium]